MTSCQGHAARVAACSLVAAFVASGPCLAQARFQRISVNDSGAEANGALDQPNALLSADGRHVAWDTHATNLSPWDINGFADVFVRDRAAGTTSLVSVALTGLTANAASALQAMSSDGRFIVFASQAYDLVKFDTNQQRDLFVHDRDPDANGTFDEGNETTVRVSVDSSGAQSDGDSFGASISDDGTKVAFASAATNLVANDLNGAIDVFVRDLVDGTTTRVSVDSGGAESDGDSGDPAIAGDGSVVMFASGASNLVAGDFNGVVDVFVHGLAAGTTDRVSLAHDGAEANAEALDCSMSADGAKVAWASDATNLVATDTNGHRDVFLRDVAAGTTVRLSLTDTGTQSHGDSDHASLSRNGGFAIFDSDANNLCGIETNGTVDVFLCDLAAGSIVKVSTRLCGAEGAGASAGYAVSDDGITIAMTHDGTDLIGGDANGISDLLVRDRTQPEIVASWQNYGAGWPGTNGIPQFTPSADPVMGSSIDGIVDNSLGFYTVGFLFFGLSPASVPTKNSGTLLVDPILVQVFLMPPGGATIGADIPLDDAIVGIHYYAQVLTIDDGATRGFSFTPGLELIAGQ